MNIYKKLLIVAGGLVGAILLVLLFIGINDYSNSHPSKYICTKSHDKTEYVYGYGMGFDGKMSWGYHWETRTICDKEEINPKWRALNG